jgi:hypothetical protein
MVIQRSQIVLIGGMLLALFAGMVLGLTTGLFKGPREAHAQPSPGNALFHLCKEWVPNGVLNGSQTFSFMVSDTSQGPPQSFDITVMEGGGAVCRILEAQPGRIDVTETVPSNFDPPSWASDTEQPTTGNLAIFTLFFDSSCVSGLVANFALVTPGQGPTTCIITFFNQDTIPIQDPVFRLCKEWRPQGAIAPPRAFTFNVADESIGLSPPVTIPNVAEDGQPDCLLLAATAGVVQITETGIAGFDTPEREIDGFNIGSGFTIDFLLDANSCAPRIEDGGGQAETFVRVVEDGDIACTITFINEDNDAPPRTIVVCPNCNATPTPPPPTATPTSPPATATNTSPPGTQPPATATPTAGVATLAPGLTDAQRTATAVAAARTAAAQSTPIAPRTGDAGAGGAGGTLNIALLAAGLIVLSSGLGLVAMRGKRR